MSLWTHPIKAIAFQLCLYYSILFQIINNFSYKIILFMNYIAFPQFLFSAPFWDVRSDPW